MLNATVYRTDAVVVGAGFIGIAVARELALQGRDVLVLEQETRHGQHQSSRNSEVIHAGFYYAPGSLKARICRDANLELYRFAELRGIPHRRIGKIVVATGEGEINKLEQLLGRAAACGVDGVELLNAREVGAMEPEVSCVAGLWSPSTGIIDTSAFLLSLRGEAEAKGVTFAMGCKVLRGEAIRDGWRLTAESGGERTVVECDLLVNSAGIEAVTLAGKLDGYPKDRIPSSYFARGNFFACEGRTPFAHLIYPVPGAVGLGVHVTLDLNGQGKFGPDVEIIDEISYQLKAERAESFYPAIRRFWPGLRQGSLTPAYCGIRAKIGKPGDPQDWVIETPSEHGVAGLVMLFGIESPGMTCALALGREVAHRVRVGALA